jgi:Tfp pilus assembly protein PilN
MIKVNLLTPEKKDIGGVSQPTTFEEAERENKISTPSGVVVFLITVGIIGWMYHSQSQTLKQKENKLTEKKARKSQLEKVLDTLKKLEKAKKTLDRKLSLIENLRDRRMDTVKMMDRVGKALPDLVWLTSLTYSDKTLRLGGKAVTNHLIADFINNLTDASYFEGIKWGGSKRKAESGQFIFDFNLSCTYLDVMKSREKVK